MVSCLVFDQSALITKARFLIRPCNLVSCSAHKDLQLWKVVRVFFHSDQMMEYLGGL
jgi:hypothetical protein